MSEQKYCSVLDDLHRHKEIDAKVLVPLLAEHCLTGLLTNRVVKRTFLAPDKKLSEKLAKMSESDAKKQLKRHVLRGFHPPKALAEKHQVFSMMDDGYELSKKGDKDITIKAGAKTLVAKFLGSRHTQALYVISEALPAHAQKLPPELKKSKSKSRSKSRSASKKGGMVTMNKWGGMVGGTPTATKWGGGMVGGTPTATKWGGGSDSDDDDTTSSESESDNEQTGGDALYAFAQRGSDDQGFDFPAGMRNLIFKQYYQKYGDLYPLTVQDNWAALAYGSLLMYLNENVPDFRTDYLPFLGNDPLSSLEILLQRYDPNISSDFSILSDSFLRGWMKSPYYLTDDFGVLREARSLLLSFCQDAWVPGLCMEDTTVLSSNVLNRERSALTELLGQNTVLMLGGSGPKRNVGLVMKGGKRNSNSQMGGFGPLEQIMGISGLGSINPLMASLDPTKEKQLREGIVAVYKRVSGEPDRFSPGTKALFKKVYEAREIPVYQGLLYNDLQRYMSMSLRDTSPQVYEQSMFSLFGQPHQVANDNILQFSMGSFQQPQQYTFPAGTLFDFTQSPAFLHMYSKDMNNAESPIWPFAVGPDGNHALFEATLVDKSRLGDNSWQSFFNKI